MKLIFILFTLFLSLSVSSKTLSKEQLVSQFYKNLLTPTLLKATPPNRCEPRPDVGSCIKAVCDKLSPFGCDDESELKNVASICRGNFNGDCINTTCASLSPFDCDEIDELTNIARSCSQTYSNDCSKFFTSHLSVFDHDDLPEILNINNQCKNVSPEEANCAQYLCNKLSQSSCDTIAKLTDILQSCMGQ